MIMELV